MVMMDFLQIKKKKNFSSLMPVMLFVQAITHDTKFQRLFWMHQMEYYKKVTFYIGPGHLPTRCTV